MINIYYLTCSVELKFRTSLATWFWLGSHAIMRTAKNRYIEGLTEEQDSHERRFISVFVGRKLQVSTPILMNSFRVDGTVIF